MEQLLQAILLGVIEGITEFLPISSTGHLILLVDILDFQGPEGKVFEVSIQVGAIMAICLVFRERVSNVLFHLHDSQTTRRFVGLIIAAFLPAAIIGFIGHSFIKEVLFSPVVVSVMLIIGGIGILIIERYKPESRIHTVDHMGWRDAVLIGFCQALAMIPGTSRSGATMMGGLLLGVDRKTAAEFSFLLAIPTMVAATIYDVYQNAATLSADDGRIIAIGLVSAFLSALLTVRWLLAFLSRHGFGVFAWYRIVIGSVMLYQFV